MRWLTALVLSTGTVIPSQSASLTGFVHDPDGNPVSAVPIALSRVGGGERFDVVSSAKGTFTFSAVPAGTFNLSIPEIGFTFRKFEQKGIVLGPSQKEQFDIRLEWAGNLGTIGDDDSTILRAGRAAAPPGPAPRMPGGKPDFSGVWNGQNDSDPEKPSVLPWADTIAKNRSERDNPSTRCLPGDVLLNTPNPFEIIQTPQKILIIAEYNVGAFREIFMDGRTHPKDVNPTWMGHSIGHWEGDVLVVDTVGFNDRSWLDVYPHSEKLHVVTRYKRPTLGHLDIQITIEDPDTFAKPWHLHHIWDLVPGEEIQEFVCENNTDPQHMDK